MVVVDWGLTYFHHNFDNPKGLPSIGIL